MAIIQPLKVAILWHMHQPNYQAPQTTRMVLPWVRLHALKDYLDMPLLATKYENVRVTFNLVPSLLEQIKLYLAGGSDPHLDLTRLLAESLTAKQKTDIINSFFSAPVKTMIEPHARYYELYKKSHSVKKDTVLPSLFSSEEMRDIQLWSNLAWVDPMFRTDDALEPLFAKERHFTEHDKQIFLDWQQQHLEKIIPTYVELFKAGKMGLSFTPYFHPILPLLCDTESAREALPDISLPKNRFQHPEDARHQIQQSCRSFEELTGVPLRGMWPSEGSVSEEVVRIAKEEGLVWLATDEEILYNSLRKSDANVPAMDKYCRYVHDEVSLFFRDHALSDRIGFVYSGMAADAAVEDFMQQLQLLYKKQSNSHEQLLVPVILDGENAWEYFVDDGYEFLDKLYSRLSEEPWLETVTLDEAHTSLPAQPLPRLFAGSWINHNFKIWIGHPEDNTAWDLLTETRNRVVEYFQNNPDIDSSLKERVWRQIYIAEGSDWCWWYGEEHRGPDNETFDAIFRSHLIAIYEMLDLDIPRSMLRPIYQTENVHTIRLPEQLITPRIDGRLTSFYEWSGCGLYKAVDTGGAMHRVTRYIDAVRFAYDHIALYIRLDFYHKKNLELIDDPVVQIQLYTPDIKTVNLPVKRPHEATPPDIKFAVNELLEVAIDRTFLFNAGNGDLSLAIKLMDGETELETFPELEMIELNLPPKDYEMFWPS